MKALKVAKYQILSTIGAIKIYYFIFLLVLLFFSASVTVSDGSFSSSGLDISTIIFLFVVGLNSFKTTFFFTQANNISRKVFFKGLIIAVFPITFTMSIIDLVINRVLNISVKCVTTYDMIYENIRIAESGINWTQSNDLKTLFGTIIWQFAIYSAIFIIGIFISLCYYRSNKIVKVIISVVPALLATSSYKINNTFIGIFNINIADIISSAFGFKSQNPYIGVFSLTILMIIFSTSIYLLTRRAVVRS
jgi:hypothetical protein